MMEASEDDALVPISALQHFVFCERQCALIHVEGVWTESELTAEGRVVHERVDLPGISGQVARSVQLRSDRLGLAGRADAVQLLPPAAPGGPVVPFPVEYKRGRAASRHADRIQLCAQAMALEEMSGVPVPRGALFYHASRRRVVVECDAKLRSETQMIAEQVHTMLEAGAIPKAVLQPKCRRCSLREACQPARAGEADAVRYLRELGGEQGDVDTA